MTTALNKGIYERQARVASFALCCWLGFLSGPSVSWAQETFPLPVPQEKNHGPWQVESLMKAPQTFPADNLGLEPENGIRPVFFSGLPYRGKPTRVFAWIGIPPSQGEKVPGIVIVHGAGGTADQAWVKAWMDRGYAAIAMDTAGSIPVRPNGNSKKWKRHAHSGPKGWGDFANIDQPVEDQWPYHAVADVLLATSLLAAQPEVDPNRIGITGASWGGYLTNIAAGLDPRLRFAAPVYGCGFLGENSSWQEGVMQRMGREKALKWLTLWDPSQYVGQAKMPMLFANGTNDRHYRMDAWQKTYREADGPTTLSLKVRMPHGHFPTSDPKEITVFADSVVRDGPPLIETIEKKRDGESVEVTYQGELDVIQAKLVYTADPGNGSKRRWLTAPMELNTEKQSATGVLPAQTVSYFVNLHDERGCIVSSEHEDIQP